MRFSGKVAVVTGGFNGIGRACVDELARHGATVYAADLAEAPSFADARVRPVALDVCREQDWSALVARIGTDGLDLQILVNCAAIYHPQSLIDEAPAQFDAHYAVNQRGAFLGMKATRPLLDRNENASIVNVSSAAAVSGRAGAMGYGASKWALRGMSRAAARELAPRIRVNCVLPGLIDTAMAANNSTTQRQAILAAIPLNRIGTASEVANTVAFLVSDQAAYITGAEIVIDGGITS